MTAKQLTDSILQLAIQGKLVPQDPNDEPASILLDRIREEKRRLVKEGVLKKKDLEEISIDDDEAPFLIPDNWEWTTISNIFIINPKVIAEDTQNAAFIPMEKIEAGYSSNYTFDIRKWGEIKKSFTNFADGDVAFAKITPCFQNRKSVIFCGLPNGIGAGTTELKVLRPIGNTIDRKYLLYFLKSQYFINEAIFKGTANQQRIVVGYLENKYFPLPPLAEQHRIVQRIEEILPIVKEYGEAYEEASKMDAELPDKLKKSILQEAIKGKLGTQNSDDEPASVLMEKIREEKKRLVKEGILKRKDLEVTPVDEEDEPFRIPESWEWCRLGNVTYMYTGNSISESEKSAKYTNVAGINYIGTKDVGFDHSINYNNGIRIPLMYQDKFKKAPSGSVLMCIEGGSAGRKIGILNEQVCFGNKLCCFNPICVNNKFVYYYLQSPTLKDIFKSNMNGIIGGVSISKLSPLTIPIPPLAEQHRIVQKIEELYAEIDNMTINNKDINETKREITEKK